MKIKNITRFLNLLAFPIKKTTSSNEKDTSFDEQISLFRKEKLVNISGK